MKGNLFKRLGAIATTAAMLASMGVTAFATNNVTTTKTGLITGEAVSGKEGVYKVTIPYETSGTYDIGVTMLAYGMLDGSDVASNDTAYSSSTMTIIGVDQINKSEMSTKSSFEFYVDTNLGDASQPGAYKMAKGQKGVVLLSGDGADGATGYMYMAAKKTGKAYLKGATGGVNTEIATDGSTNIGTVTKDKFNSIEGAVKDLIVANVLLSANSSDTIAKTDITSLAVKNGTNGYDSANRAAQDVIYTVTASNETTEATTFDVKVTFEANPFMAVAAQRINMTVNDTTISTMAALTEAVLTELNKGATVITFKDSTDESENTCTYTIANGDVTTASNAGDGKFVLSTQITTPGTNGAGNTYTLVIPAESTKLASVNIKNSNEISVELIVAIKQPWKVTGKTVTKNDAAVSEPIAAADITLSDGDTQTTAENITSAVAVALNGVTVTAKGTDNGASVTEQATQKGKEYWKIKGSTANAEYGSISGSYSADTYTVKVPYTVSSVATDSDNLLYLEVKVTVKEASKGLKGDVNYVGTAGLFVNGKFGDGAVDAFDAQDMARWSAGWPTYKDMESIDLSITDVNGDTYFDAFDAQDMARWSAGWPKYETLISNTGN